MMTRILLTLALPFWLFGMGVLMQAAASLIDKSALYGEKWWHFPLAVTAVLPCIALGLGGFLLVAILWLMVFI